MQPSSPLSFLIKTQQKLHSCRIFHFYLSGAPLEDTLEECLEYPFVSLIPLTFFIVIPVSFAPTANISQSDSITTAGEDGRTAAT